MSEKKENMGISWISQYKLSMWNLKKMFLEWNTHAANALILMKYKAH